MSFVLQHRRVHRIPRTTLVTIAKRPSCERGTGGTMLLIWGFAQCLVAAADWHDGQISFGA
jgi:hypothetical protein